MLIIILIILILYTLILRKKLSRDQKEYIYYREIPSDDSPALVGKIIKGHTDGNDIISTILDLSYRGYIRIEKEKIKGREESVLYVERNYRVTDLKEHEMFLINQIFKNNDRIVFNDYIKSKKFKQDFKAFDKMLERRKNSRMVYKSSVLKNINKILLLISYFIFGIGMFYSITLPIVLFLNSVVIFNIKTAIIINIVISGIIYIFIAYKYIQYIEKLTNARENINLGITYIILTIIIGCVLIFSNNVSISNIISDELIWYKVIVNFIISLVTIMYMFNIIKHTEKEEYLYYTFLIISVFSIILDMKISMGICIIFFIVYIFFKVPKYSKLKQEDYLEKWLSFKKYLEDYSMLSNQDANAIAIWEKYLIYAISLGINKKIIRKYAQLNDIELLNEIYLKKIYVEYFE